MKLVQEVWSKNQHLTVPEKLSVLKDDLKKWNTLEFGVIDEKIKQYEGKIHFLIQLQMLTCYILTKCRKEMKRNGSCGLG